MIAMIVHTICVLTSRRQPVATLNASVTPGGEMTHDQRLASRDKSEKGEI